MSDLGGLDSTQLLELVRRDPAAGRDAMQAAVMARAGSDPRLGALMGLLAQSRPAPEAPPPEGSGRADRIRQRILDMREELDYLRERNEALAAALGACAACWGQALGCRQCRGRGAAGWRSPDPDLFAQLVAPALTRREHPAAKDTESLPLKTRGDE